MTLHLVLYVLLRVTETVFLKQWFGHRWLYASFLWWYSGVQVQFNLEQVFIGFGLNLGFISLLKLNKESVIRVH